MAGTIGVPKTTISLLPSSVVETFADRRSIIFGVGEGSATALALNTDVQSLTNAELAALFGANSHLLYTILKWKEANGNYSPLDVITVASITGAAATSSIALTGTSTAAGTYKVSAVDEKAFTATVAIPSGTAAADAADLIDAALTALGVRPFTNAAATGTVTLTAPADGTHSNAYGLKVAGTIPGLSFTLTGWAGGTGDAVLTGVLGNISGLRYTSVLWPSDWEADLSTIVDEMELRFNASEAVMDGAVYTGRWDTLANQNTFLDTQNYKTLTVFMQALTPAGATEQKGGAIIQPADWVAAYFMGVKARRLSTGAPISDFVISTAGALDAFGGPHTASLPYFNTPLKKTPLTLPNYLYAALEQTELESAGGSIVGVDPSVSTMITGPVTTTWVTDAAGNVNGSFHYANYVDTGSVCREIFFRNLKALFSQTRLTTGDLVPGYSITNEADIKAKLLKIYKDLAKIALTRAGGEEEGYFSLNTTVAVDLATRSVTITGPLQIVTQVETILYALKLNFNIGSDVPAEEEEA